MELENHSGFLQSENKKFAHFRYLYLFKAFTEVSLMSCQSPTGRKPGHSVEKKEKKLKGIFKHQSPGASALKKKNVQNDLPSVSLSPLKGEIAVMSLTFFAVLPKSCLVRRRKDEHGSHLSWNVEILLRL